MERPKSEPTLYYVLACGTGAAYLEVGTPYEAAEAYSKDGVKILVIGVKSETEPDGIIVIGCDVESERTADDSKR